MTVSYYNNSSSHPSRDFCTGYFCRALIILFVCAAFSVAHIFVLALIFSIIPLVLSIGVISFIVIIAEYRKSHYRVRKVPVFRV